MHAFEYEANSQIVAPGLDGGSYHVAVVKDAGSANALDYVCVPIDVPPPPGNGGGPTPPPADEATYSYDGVNRTVHPEHDGFTLSLDSEGNVREFDYAFNDTDSGAAADLSLFGYDSPPNGEGEYEITEQSGVLVGASFDSDGPGPNPFAILNPFLPFTMTFRVTTLPNGDVRFQSTLTGTGNDQSDGSTGSFSATLDFVVPAANVERP